jgi:uncharacterized protein YbaA (DUF1428 family)
MDILNYDFESALEQGFKTLLAETAARIADDVGEGELTDERVTVEVVAGAVISDEHQNAANIYDNYGGTLTVDIHSPRVPNDQVATGAGFKNRHRELVATVRKTLEEIDASVLSTNWPGALSPTKITPSGTDRENDKDSQMTTLTYSLQFRIA